MKFITHDQYALYHSTSLKPNIDTWNWCNATKTIPWNRIFLVNDQCYIVYVLHHITFVHIQSFIWHMIWTWALYLFISCIEVPNFKTRLIRPMITLTNIVCMCQTYIRCVTFLSVYIHVAHDQYAKVDINVTWKMFPLVLFCA